MEWINKQRAAWRVRTSPRRAALKDLPSGLEPAWRHSAPHEYQGIPTDAFFFACAAEGLMDFFDAATQSGKPCALPSDAADSVWHAWLRHDPIGLERFCRKHFGAVVPHVEREGLGAGALLNTFAACHGLARRRLRLPRLFGLDARLRMPGGHGYWMRLGEIVYARVGEQGWGLVRARPHPELGIEDLYMADVVDRHTLAAALRLRLARANRAQADDGGSWGVDLPLFAAMSDSGSDGGCGDAGSGGGDSSCDSGSSCGSSCGGGGGD
jgi:uncharacterized membrane protein YgcG